MTVFLQFYVSRLYPYVITAKTKEFASQTRQLDGPTYMKFFSRPILSALFLILCSQSAWSAETFLSVFLNNRPVQGLEVRLDDEMVGETASEGSLTYEMDAGEHILQLSENGTVILNYSYLTMQRENAEISVAFSDLAEEPEIVIEKYFPGAEKAGAPGIIQGSVSSADGIPISGATVSLVDTEYQATTNESGGYLLEVPHGTYTLEVSHPDYRTSTQEGIRVVANVGFAVNVNLSTPRQENKLQIAAPSLAPIEEVLILGRFEPTDTTLDIERMSTAIVDAIDADQLARFGDSSAASALKRVAGVDVNDGKYAVVRGLDRRYISSTLNDNLMPTTDPLRRDVQLDLFPANILGSIQIQKSYTADMPGDTTGGSIGMVTRNAPDERVHQVSLSAGYNFQVTGDDIVTYEGSDSDWLTYDDGLRDMPSEVDQVFFGEAGSSFHSVNTCNNSSFCDISYEENARLAQQFPAIYDVETEQAEADFGLGYSYGNRFEPGFGSLGYYGSVSFKNETEARLDAVVNSVTESTTYDRSTKSSELGAYLVFGLEDNHGSEWLSRTIFLRQADDVTRLESGVNTNEDTQFETAVLHWTERQFVAQQLSAAHSFFDTHTFNWRAGVSQTTVNEPDRRTWTYLEGTFIPTLLERRYAELTEDGLDFGFDYSLPIDFSANVSTDLKLGYLYNNRDREWDLARYSFRLGRGGNPDDITAGPEILLSHESLENQHYQLRKSTAGGDSFLAEIETSAYYLQSETKFVDSFSLVAGVRVEDNEQTIEYPYGTDSAPSILDELDTLPVIGFGYYSNDVWQFRISASQTVSRPGIIERSQSTMYDPDTDEQIFGNPNLVSASIDNVDMRFEYYWDDGGSVSLAIFGKQIDNPIERAIPEGSGSAVRNSYTFRNNLSAGVSGVELDGYKILMEDANWSMFVGGNLSFIESEVELNATSLRLEGEDSKGRELQGQSPFLANVQFGLDHSPTGQQATLLINYFDDKIYKVGRGSLLGNEIELGRVSVDFTYEKEFENLSKINVKIENLLNEEVEYSQNDVIIERYKKGTELSVKYTHSF